MAAVLVPDDFTVGDMITVLHGVTFDRVVSDGDDITTTIVQRENTSYQGNVLRIEVINLPFIIVTRLAHRFGRESDRDSFSLDIRRFQFMRLSPEYVKTLTKQR